MSKSCCESKSSELTALHQRQGNVLKWVLLINAAMFFVEFGAGIMAKSSALLADSLDMFGDATVYALSIYALHRGIIWRARAGLFKGVVMLIFGIFVMAQVIYKVSIGIVPVAETMGVIGSLALSANLTCVLLLYRHRADDINMRSTWLCSRNDILANVGVLTASVLVGFTGSLLPDAIVGTAIAILFLKSSAEVISEAREEIRKNTSPTPAF